MDLMDRFEAEFGSTTCRGLLGIDLREPGEHDRFIESGVWQTNCMAQIEFAVAMIAENRSWTPWAGIVLALNVLGEAAAGQGDFPAARRYLHDALETAMKQRTPMFFVVWTAVIALIILHQDNWLWDNPRLVFGFLPITLLYHMGISLAATVRLRFQFP